MIDQGMHSGGSEALMLPQDVIVAMLNEVDACGVACRSGIDALLPRRQELRELLAPVIRTLGEAPDDLRLGAVDGTYTSIVTASVSFVTVAAFRLLDNHLDYRSLTRSIPVSEDMDAILSGIRNLLELDLLATATESAYPHELTILDGSFWGVLQETNRLFSQLHRLRHETALLSAINLAVASFIQQHHLLTIVQGEAVIANSKKAVSDRYIRQYAPELAGRLRDRALFSAILEPGEYTEPRRLMEGVTGSGPVSPPGMDVYGDSAAVAQAYRERIFVVYYRPRPWSPAYRLEILGSWATDVPRLHRLLASFRTSLPSPDILEPEPQFLVDRFCRSVPAALEAVKAGTLNYLFQEYPPDIVRSFFGAYRTQQHVERAPLGPSHQGGHL